MGVETFLLVPAIPCSYKTCSTDLHSSPAVFLRLPLDRNFLCFCPVLDNLPWFHIILCSNCSPHINETNLCNFLENDVWNVKILRICMHGMSFCHHSCFIFWHNIEFKWEFFFPKLEIIIPFSSRFQYYISYTWRYSVCLPHFFSSLENVGIFPIFLEFWILIK